MKLIIISFYYVFIYTFVISVSLILLPDEFQNLISSSIIYDSVSMRLVGLVMFMVSMLFFELIRKKLVKQTYLITIFARTVGILVLMLLFYQTGNYFFLYGTIVVSVGVIMTTVGHFKKI